MSAYSDSPFAPPHPLVQRLIDAGIIPKQCHSWELRLNAGDVARLTMDIFITEADFQKVADALIESKEAGQELARTIVFKTVSEQSGILKDVLTVDDV
jgi:hypothetical protein